MLGLLAPQAATVRGLTVSEAVTAQDPSAIMEATVRDRYVTEEAPVGVCFVIMAVIARVHYAAMEVGAAHLHVKKEIVQGHLVPPLGMTTMAMMTTVSKYSYPMRR